MPITSIETDPEALTMTVVADFPVPVSRLWEAYSDPRQIEKFWGPPGWPATFLRHDMIPGGTSLYFMAGPDGEASYGYWEFVQVEELTSFAVLDGFAHPDGTPNPDLPTTRTEFTFTQTGDGSRMHSTTTFNTLDELQQLSDMGMEEGLRGALGQLDDVLADLASFAAGRGTESQILSETQVRITRVIRGSIQQVWDAHHDPELLQRWLLGPEGWTMPVCEVATGVGETYRYEWEQADGEGRFGFTGELLEASPPHRWVTTERMIGVDGDGVVNDTTLRSVEGGTLMTQVTTYPSAELRDYILATGMTDGMEASYARLESEVLAGA